MVVNLVIIIHNCTSFITFQINNFFLILASYEEAKSKLSTAEFKSDLSTAEDERYTRQFRAANKRVSRNSSSPEIVKNSRSKGMKSPPSVFCMTILY